MKNMKKLYFDCNATTPVAPEVFSAIRPWLEEGFGNPGCCHDWGAAAKDAVDRARAELAGLVGAEPEEICFTGGATEADNMALLGVVDPALGQGLAVSAVEHPAVVCPARVLEGRGVRLSLIPVDGRGLVDPDGVMKLCGPDTRLVSVMLANNETGVIQPVAEIAARCRERGILMHTDAAQAVGKIPVDVRRLGVDLMTVAGHKMYAPKGVGALYVRKGVEVSPLVFGGGQEGGLRPGTENVPYIAGLGAAAAMAARDIEVEGARQRELGAMFLEGLSGLGVDFRVWGEGAERLPQTAYVGFGGLSAGDVLSGLVGLDVGVSGGAACHAGQSRVSSVLEAMDAPLDYAAGTIRFSWGRMTTRDDVAELLVRLGIVLRELAK